MGLKQLLTKILGLHKILCGYNKYYYINIIIAVVAFKVVLGLLKKIDLKSDSEVKVEVEFKAAADDYLQFFYTPVGETNAQEKFSQVIYYKGSNEFQKLEFKIADTVQVNTFRLDFGVNQ